MLTPKLFLRHGNLSKKKFFKWRVEKKREMTAFHSELWVKGLDKNRVAMFSCDTETEDEVPKRKLSEKFLELFKPKKEKRAEPANCLKEKYGVCWSKVIGRGATSCVKLVTVTNSKDPNSLKTLAVKEFRKRRKKESEKEYIKKMAAEFCISSSLHHENVVETLDLVVDDNHTWCEVMEYCSGMNYYPIS